MEFQDVLTQRQSIRKYLKTDIPTEHIEAMVQAAGLAPSGKNAQNWYFIASKSQAFKDGLAHVITEKNEQISRNLDEIEAGRGDRFRKILKNVTLFFTEAPVVIVAMTKVVMPSGYFEMKETGADDQSLDFLVRDTNPGMQSFGAALENLSLKAVDLGYGTCWLTSASYAAGEVEDFLRREAAFKKEGFFLGAILSVGIPDGSTPVPKRKPLHEILTIVD